MGSFKKNTVSTRTTSKSENLSYMPGFGNDFETEALPAHYRRDKIALKNVITDFMENNSLEQHLLLQAIKMKEPGAIAFVHR